MAKTSKYGSILRKLCNIFTQSSCDGSMDKATDLQAGGPEFGPPRKPFFCSFLKLFFISFFKFFMPERARTLILPILPCPHYIGTPLYKLVDLEKTLAAELYPILCKIA